MEPLFFCDGKLAVLGTFDFSYLPELLFYSFIPSTLLSLILAVYIFLKDNSSTQATLLLFTSLSFSIWTLNDTLQWITVPANLNFFFWELTVLFEILLVLTLCLFVRVFSKNIQKISKVEMSIFAILLLPVLLLLPTKLNLVGFDLTVCEGVVAPLINYAHLIGVIASFVIFVQIIHLFIHKKTSAVSERGQFNSRIIIATAALFFISIFNVANIIGETTKAYVIGLIAPIGMNLFLILLVYTIVRFKAFNIKLVGAQALVITLWTLVGSLLFVVESNNAIIISTATLIFTSIAGYLLIRSVKKEVRRKEELQVLTQKLAHANEKLKELDKLKSEFVSIASHQLRSPLTAIRGYASLLADGSYGKLPQKAMEALDRISESSKNMAYSIEDYLNVSRIESGNMKYNYSDFNLKDEVEKMTDDLRSQAIQKGLGMIFRSDLKSRGVVHADIGKTVQIIQNLINNSIKYTPTGSIKVLVRDDVVKKKIYVDIIDTGIGMDEKTQNSIFGKFERARNANSVNTTGTGLGLYVALMMAEAMGGSIKATSEGDGKGSIFTLELPLAM